MTGTIERDEAERLFQNINKAMQEDDSSKLSDLLAQETPPAEEPEEEEQPVEDTPADEPEKEEQVEEDTPSDEDGKEKEETPADPLEELRQQIAELKKAQQSASSQIGRVPSLQRKLSEYDKQLAELRSATSSQASEKALPKIEAALKDLEDTDPNLAKAIKTAMGEALSGVDNEAHAREIARIESLRESDYAEYAAVQKEILLNKYPNAADVFASDSWKSWKKQQPAHVLNLAQSDDAGAVIMALDMYKQRMLELHPELAQPTAQTPAVVVDERATKIEEERKRQQQKAANISSGKAPSAVKQPADLEALFKQYSDDIRKEITGK